jgi:hypothetical protein
MSEASVFRQYAEEAMRDASNAETETERKALQNLAYIWAQAASMSARGIGPHFTAALRAVAETAPRAAA